MPIAKLSREDKRQNVLSQRHFDGVSEGRRRNMQANRSTDTKPELTIRRLLHAMGYRFRLHVKDLPGRPDIVFTAKRKVIEVHGCFWHAHGCTPLGQPPKSRKDYWGPKLLANRERDARKAQALGDAGWQLFVVWECEVRSNADAVLKKLSRFLGPTRDQRG